LQVKEDGPLVEVSFACAVLISFDAENKSKLQIKGAGVLEAVEEDGPQEVNILHHQNLN
jgi:hypothetical protein